MRTTHTISRTSSVIMLDTAWMPLEGITEQWAHFGMQASSVFALRATSTAFGALATETDARERHQEAYHLAPYVDLSSLEHALQCLSTARQAWTDVMMALEPLLVDASDDEAVQSLLTQTLQQRTRLSCLLQEVEREHLSAYQQQTYHQCDIAVYALCKEG